MEGREKNVYETVLKESYIGLVQTSWESCHPQMSSDSDPSELYIQVVR